MDVRETLERLIRERGDDYAALSRLLGRNAAYVQQFIRRGTPRRLAEDDRRRLAQYFGVDETLLGGPAPAPRAGLQLAPRLDVRVSAGPGGAALDERGRGGIGFDERFLRGLGVEPAHASLVRVGGDSMEPTLADGDELLVDTRPHDGRLREGIYVLRIDDALNVKRLAPRPGGRVLVTSDNDRYPPFEAARAEVTVIGRVVWVGRRLR